eukprot:182894_1
MAWLLDSLKSVAVSPFTWAILTVFGAFFVQYNRDVIMPDISAKTALPESPVRSRNAGMSWEEYCCKDFNDFQTLKETETAKAADPEVLASFNNAARQFVDHFFTQSQKTDFHMTMSVGFCGEPYALGKDALCAKLCCSCRSLVLKATCPKAEAPLEGKIDGAPKVAPAACPKPLKNDDVWLCCTKPGAGTKPETANASCNIVTGSKGRIESVAFAADGKISPNPAKSVFWLAHCAAERRKCGNV